MLILQVEQIIKQKGRCIYSGILLQFTKRNHGQASPDRVNDNWTYCASNVQFLVGPLNTTYKLSLDEFQTISKSMN